MSERLALGEVFYLLSNFQLTLILKVNYMLNNSETWSYLLYLVIAC